MATDPFDRDKFLSTATSGSAAAEQTLQSLLKQGFSAADAASSARYTGQAYDYFAQQKAAEEAKAKAEAEAKAKAEAEKAAKAASDLLAAQNANNAAALANAQAALAAAQAAANSAAAAAQQVAQDAAAKAAAEAAAKAEEIAAQRESVGKIVADRFAQYGLSTLGTKVLDLARQGYTEATITLELQKTDEYAQRFRANQERIKKGLAVLSPAEYIATEDAYRQTLRAYGLRQFDTDAYVTKFIENDVSPSELSARVVAAVQRVQNADPVVATTLRDYYNVSEANMLGYILDPATTLPQIERQITSAEITAAAAAQGLQPGRQVAEQLAMQGVTKDVAQKGYATIADILPTAEKLSSIYGDTMDTYGRAEAEQEVFGSLASAERKRRALAERETSQFAGKAGTSRASLTSQKSGLI